MVAWSKPVASQLQEEQRVPTSLPRNARCFSLGPYTWSWVICHGQDTVGVFPNNGPQHRPPDAIPIILLMGTPKNQSPNFGNRGIAGGNMHQLFRQPLAQSQQLASSCQGLSGRAGPEPTDLNSTLLLNYLIIIIFCYLLFLLVLLLLLLYYCYSCYHYQDLLLLLVLSLLRFTIIASSYYYYQMAKTRTF